MVTDVSLPKYQRIAKQIHQRILVGDYEERLPSRQALADLFQVNGRTIDKALDLLEPKQVIQRRRGIGVFVHPQLRGVVIRNFYVVFPGHKATLAGENPYHRLLGGALNEILTVSHALSLEPRLLPIDPDHSGEIAWNMLMHLVRDDYALFFTRQYGQVIRELAGRGVRCVTLLASDTDDGAYRDLPVMFWTSDFAALAGDVVGRMTEQGGRHLALAFANSDLSHALSSNLAAGLRQVLKDDEPHIRWDFEADQQAAAPSLVELGQRVRDRLREQPTLDGLIATSPGEAEIIAEVLRDRPDADRRPVQLFCLDTMNQLEPQPGLVVYRHDVASLVQDAMQVLAGSESFKPGCVRCRPFLVLDDSEPQTQADHGKLAETC